MESSILSPGVCLAWLMQRRKSRALTASGQSSTSASGTKVSGSAATSSIISQSMDSKTSSDTLAQDDPENRRGLPTCDPRQVGDFETGSIPIDTPITSTQTRADKF